MCYLLIAGMIILVSGDLAQGRSNRDSDISREIWSLARNWTENRSEVLKNLGSTDPVRRRVAVNALPVSVDREDALLVVPLILDPDIKVQSAATSRFLDWRMDEAIPNLAQVLDLGGKRARRTAAMALSMQCSEKAYTVLDSYVMEDTERIVLEALDSGLNDVTCVNPEMEKRKMSLARKVGNLLGINVP